MIDTDDRLQIIKELLGHKADRVHPRGAFGQGFGAVQGRARGPSELAPRSRGARGRDGARRPRLVRGAHDTRHRTDDPATRRSRRGGRDPAGRRLRDGSAGSHPRRRDDLPGSGGGARLLGGIERHARGRDEPGPRRSDPRGSDVAGRGKRRVQPVAESGRVDRESGGDRAARRCGQLPDATAAFRNPEPAAGGCADPCNGRHPGRTRFPRVTRGHSAGTGRSTAGPLPWRWNRRQSPGYRAGKPPWIATSSSCTWPRVSCKRRRKAARWAKSPAAAAWSSSSASSLDGRAARLASIPRN